MRSVPVVFLLGISFYSTSAYGYLKCTSKQKSCVVKDRALTIGDEVGFLNQNDQIVAKGVVTKLEGTRRWIEIRERTGTISRSSELIVLSHRSFSNRPNKEYVMYRKPSKTMFGFAGGIASPAIGESSSGFELTGFYQFTRWKEIQILGRFQYLNATAELSKAEDADGIETRTMNLSSFGAIASGAYTAFEHMPVALRSEIGIGLKHISADVGGNADLVANSAFETKVENGLSLGTRGDVAALIDFETYKISTGLGYTYYHQAGIPSLQIGFVKPL